MSDGMIVIADGGSSELRVFTSAGTFLRSFGRFGDGPREFRALDWIDTCGGRTVVAYDGFRDRITEWNREGMLVDEFFVEGPGGNLPPYQVSCGPSGGYVVVGWPDITTGPSTGGPYRPNVVIGIADEHGRIERVVGEFPGSERLRTAHNDRPHPFGKTTVARLGPGGLYVGTADSFAIRLISPDGGRSTFGRDVPVEPLTDEMRERWVDAYVSRAPPEQREYAKRGILDSEWLPDIPPAYEGFRIDRLGLVWVTPYLIRNPDSTAPVEWSVFDAGGRLVATVLVPDHFRPMEIGSEHVLGVSTDALGVERVHRYTLFR